MTAAESTKAEREGDPHEGAFKAEPTKEAQEAPDGGPQTDRPTSLHIHGWKHLLTNRKKKGEGGAGGAGKGGPPHKNARPKGRTPLCPKGARWEGEREGEWERAGPSHIRAT